MGSRSISTVFLDTVGLVDGGGNSFPAGSTLDLSYTPSWDTTELENTRILFDAGTYGGADSGGNNGVPIVYTGLTIPQPDAPLTEFDFTVLPGLINDGAPDFSIRLNTADVINAAGVNLGSVTAQLDGNRDVSVQAPEPASTLGLLAIGIGGAALTLKRKLKHSKYIEKETTKVS